MSAERAYEWDRLGNDWRRRRPQRLWREHSDRVNERLLERWLPAEQVATALKTDLFDEAFGKGIVGRLTARAASVVGIDLSGVVLEEARRQCAGLQALRCDIRWLPFRDASLNMVVSLSTIDHFTAREDLRKSLDEIRRVLAPHGVLILTMDNPANPLVALRNRLPFRILHGLRLVPYYVGFTAGPWRARRLLEEAGFHVQEQMTIVHCPRVIAVAACNLLERAAPRIRRAFLRTLLAFEGLERWPTAPWSGHFVALRAIRR